MGWKESKVAQFCLTLCHPTDCSPPGSSLHGILQAGVLEWVATSFSWGSSRPRDWTQVSHIAGRHLTIWATWETTWEGWNRFPKSQEPAAPTWDARCFPIPFFLPCMQCFIVLKVHVLKREVGGLGVGGIACSLRGAFKTILQYCQLCGLSCRYDRWVRAVRLMTEHEFRRLQLEHIHILNALAPTSQSLNPIQNLQVSPVW